MSSTDKAPTVSSLLDMDPWLAMDLPQSATMPRETRPSPSANGTFDFLDRPLHAHEVHSTPNSAPSHGRVFADSPSPRSSKPGVMLSATPASSSKLSESVVIPRRDQEPQDDDDDVDNQNPSDSTVTLDGGRAQKGSVARSTNTSVQGRPQSAQRPRRPSSRPSSASTASRRPKSARGEGSQPNEKELERMRKATMPSPGFEAYPSTEVAQPVLLSISSQINAHVPEPPIRVQRFYHQHQMPRTYTHSPRMHQDVLRYSNLDQDHVELHARVNSARALGVQLLAEAQSPTSSVRSRISFSPRGHSSDKLTDDDDDMDASAISIQELTQLQGSMWGHSAHTSRHSASGGGGSKRHRAHVKWLARGMAKEEYDRQESDRSIRTHVATHRPFQMTQKALVSAHDWSNSVRSLKSYGASFGGENQHARFLVQGKHEDVLPSPLKSDEQQDKTARAKGDEDGHTKAYLRRRSRTAFQSQGSAYGNVSRSEMLRRVNTDVSSHILAIRLKAYAEVHARAQEGRQFCELARSSGLLARLINNFLLILPARKKSVDRSMTGEELAERKQSRRARMLAAQKAHLQRQRMAAQMAALGSSSSPRSPGSSTDGSGAKGPGPSPSTPGMKQQSANVAGLTEFQSLLSALGALCDNNSENRSMLRENDGIEHMVQLLDAPRSYVAHVLPLVIQVCEDDLRNQLEFDRADGLAELVRVIQESSDVNVTTAAIAATCSACSDNKLNLKRAFVKLGLMDMLHHIVNATRGRYKLRETALLAIFFAARQDEVCLEHMVETDVLSAAVSFIDSLCISPRLLCSLADVAQDAPSVQTAALDAGILGYILHYLQHRDTEYLVAAMDLAVALCKRNKRAAGAVAASVSASIILPFLNARQPAPLRHSAVRLAFVLAKESSEARDLLGGTALRTVIGQLANEPTTRNAAYFGLVSATCYDMPENQEYFREQGGLDVLCTLLAREDMTAEQTAAALVCLADVCHGNAANVTHMISMLETATLYRALSCLPSGTSFYAHASDLWRLACEVTGEADAHSADNVDAGNAGEGDDVDGGAEAYLKGGSSEQHTADDEDEEVRVLEQTKEPLLLFAVRDRNLRELQRLLGTVKVDANLTGNLGMGGLHVLATMLTEDDELQLPKLCDMLLRHGADLDLQDNEGRTPLITCVRTGNRHVFDWLLANGADVNCLNRRGRPALACLLDMERDETFDHMFTALLRAGADVELCVHKEGDGVMERVGRLKRQLLVELATD